MVARSTPRRYVGGLGSSGAGAAIAEKAETSPFYGVKTKQNVVLAGHQAIRLVQDPGGHSLLDVPGWRRCRVLGSGLQRGQGQVLRLRAAVRAKRPLAPTASCPMRPGSEIADRGSPMRPSSVRSDGSAQPSDRHHLAVARSALALQQFDHGGRTGW